LDFINGYPIPKRLSVSEVDEKKILDKVLERAAEAKTKFTYGDKQFHVKQHELRYIPAHIVFDKKVCAPFPYITRIDCARSCVLMRTSSKLCMIPPNSIF
jgi:hypothetical protein